MARMHTYLYVLAFNKLNPDETGKGLGMPKSRGIAPRALSAKLLTMSAKHLPLRTSQPISPPPLRISEGKGTGDSNVVMAGCHALLLGGITPDMSWRCYLH